MEVKGNNDARAKIVCRGAFYYASLNFFNVIFFSCRNIFRRINMY